MMTRFVQPLMVVLCAVGPVFAQTGESIKWRTDYDTARKEATEKNLPLLIDVQTDQCVYCRKMDASTFLDSGIITMANGNFIPLKIDANRDRQLAQALHVQLYPTIVLAGPDGKVHSFMQGYVSADQMRDPMKRVSLAIGTPEGVMRDLESASKAVANSEYAKAIVLFQNVIADGKSTPAVERAKSALNEIETLAAQKLVVAKNKEIAGDFDGAVVALADMSKQFAGTKTAETATARLAGLAGRTNTGTITSRELLAQAREYHRTNQFADCLESCDKLLTRFATSLEAQDAKQLVATIQNDPDRIAQVIERQNEKTATLYLTLADAWQKKGQMKEAQACLEQVTRLCPDTRFANAARAKLAEIPGAPTATPASFKK